MAKKELIIKGTFRLGSICFAIESNISFLEVHPKEF